MFKGIREWKIGLTLFQAKLLENHEGMETQLSFGWLKLGCHRLYVVFLFYFISLCIYMSIYLFVIYIAIHFTSYFQCASPDLILYSVLRIH